MWKKHYFQKNIFQYLFRTHWQDVINKIQQGRKKFTQLTKHQMLDQTLAWRSKNTKKNPKTETIFSSKTLKECLAHIHALCGA